MRLNLKKKLREKSYAQLAYELFKLNVSARVR